MHIDKFHTGTKKNICSSQSDSHQSPHVRYDTTSLILLSQDVQKLSTHVKMSHFNGFMNGVRP